jgi:plastocyanin
MQRLSLRGGATVLLLAAALTASAGCGGDAEGQTPEGRTVTVKRLDKLQSGVDAQIAQWVVDIPVADGDEPAFTVSEVIAPVGTANFSLRNSTGEKHNLTIGEVGGGSIATPNIRSDKAWIRISLDEEKKYVFYCSLHRAEGMEGTITVDPKLSAEDLKPY